MTYQLIVSTMNRHDDSLIEKMNIHSDAIVGNQCDRNEIESFAYEGNTVQWLSFAERGVGLNRNNALMRANADIVLFADDDVVYYDDYVQTICHYYEDHPKADVVVFNFKMRAETAHRVLHAEDLSTALQKDLSHFHGQFQNPIFLVDAAVFKFFRHGKKSP